MIPPYQISVSVISDPRWIFFDPETCVAWSRALWTSKIYDHNHTFIIILTRRCWENMLDTPHSTPQVQRINLDRKLSVPQRDGDMMPRGVAWPSISLGANWLDETARTYNSVHVPSLELALTYFNFTYTHPFKKRYSICFKVPCLLMPRNILLMHLGDHLGTCYLLNQRRRDGSAHHNFTVIGRFRYNLACYRISALDVAFRRGTVELLPHVRTCRPYPQISRAAVPIA